MQQEPANRPLYRVVHAAPCVPAKLSKNGFRAALGETANRSSRAATVERGFDRAAVRHLDIWLEAIAANCGAPILPPGPDRRSRGSRIIDASARRSGGAIRLPADCAASSRQRQARWVALKRLDDGLGDGSQFVSAPHLRPAPKTLAVVHWGQLVKV